MRKLKDNLYNSSSDSEKLILNLKNEIEDLKK